MACDFCTHKKNSLVRKSYLPTHLFEFHKVRRGVCKTGDRGEHCRHRSCPAFQDYHFQTHEAYLWHLRRAHDESAFDCAYPKCKRIGRRGFSKEKDLLAHQIVHISWLTRFLLWAVRCLSPSTLWLYRVMGLSVVMSALSNKPLASGSRRVFWACASILHPEANYLHPYREQRVCSMVLHDDFLEIESGALDDLERRLNEPPPATDSPAGEDSTGPPSNLKRSWPLPKSLIGWAFSARKSSAPPSLPEHSVFDLQKLQATMRAVGPHQSKLVYLLCCINNGKIGTMLHQEILTNVASDRALFIFLKDTYNRRRNWWHSLYPLRTVRYLRLVKVRAAGRSAIQPRPQSLKPLCNILMVEFSSYSTSPNSSTSVDTSMLVQMGLAPACRRPKRSNLRLVNTNVTRFRRDTYRPLGRII